MTPSIASINSLPPRPAGLLDRLRRAALALGFGMASLAAWAQAPTITTQPQSQTVAAGQPATFTVAATGSAPANLTYQWYRRTTGDFSLILGANATSYSTGATTAGMNGYQYRVVVRDLGRSGWLSTTSASATLTVTSLAAPVVAYSPNSATLTVGTAMAAMTPTNSGGAATSWSISPALPAGLGFSTSTGQISGTPTAAKASTAYTVTATNAAGSGTTTVTLTVNAALQAPVISYSPNSATLAVGTAMAAMTPSNTGGAAASWGISPALPSGLAFSTSTGQLSGTPAAVQAATAYTVTATNAAGSGSTTLTLTVNPPAAAPVISYSPNSATLTVGTAMAAMTPSNAGGTATSWSISPALPSGLAFSTSTGQLSGTPTAAQAATAYTVTATNAGGSGTATVTLSINPKAPVPAYSPSTATFYVGTAIATMVPANSGGASTAWSVSPALPSGLAFNTANGQISGTPTAPAAQATYTVTAANAGGSGSATLTLAVVAGPPPPSIGYSPNSADLTVGVAMSALNPLNAGGAASAWSINPPLSAGISLNASTGVISGTPTASRVLTGYTVTASNANGSSSATVTISVVGSAQAPSISYSPNTATLTTGTAMAPLTPTNTGGAATSWSISPALSAGLGFNTANGQISGTPTAARAATAYTVTAANAQGSNSTTVTLTVNAALQAPVIGYSPASVTLVAGTAMAAMTPSNSGGTATSWSVTPALPQGLVFDTASGQISGVPAAAQVATNYVVTASNAAGSGSTTVTIIVDPATAAPSISYSPSSATLTVGTPMTAMTPANTGGAATSWSVSPALPAGLSFGTSNGQISGTPTAAAAQANYSVTASNAAGSNSATVTLTVNAASQAPVVSNLTATPATVTGTQSTTLSWTVTGTVTSQVLTPGDVPIPVGTTTISVTPGTTTTYTVTATNGALSGAASVTVTVQTGTLGPLTWKRDIVYLGTKEVAEISATGVTVTLVDHLGSPRFVVEPGGNVVEQKFLPFGESLLAQADQARVAKGFTNHEQTDPSGLIYMQARFYGPMYHRFLSTDPAQDQHFELTQSWNIYSYVQNQPASSVDITGLFKVGIHQGITFRSAIKAGITNNNFIFGIVARVKDTDFKHPMMKNQHFDGKSNINSIIDNFNTFVSKKESLGTVKGIGDALHAVQDFYSHSNYVEIFLKVHPDAKPGELPTLKEALAGGDKELIGKLNKELRTGNFNLARPFDDKPGTHGELNKDSDDPKKSTEGGKVHGNHTLHEYAVNVAERESSQLLERNKNRINNLRN
ncbi:MAG: putative Ig domain-containing protein [Holophagaceae bacterium]